MTAIESLKRLVPEPVRKRLRHYYRAWKANPPSIPIRFLR